MNKDLFGNVDQLYLPAAQVWLNNTSNLVSEIKLNTKNSIYKCFSSLKISNGYLRSTILDTQRGEYHNIDKKTANLLQSNKIEGSIINKFLLETLINNEIIFGGTKSLINLFVDKSYTMDKIEFYPYIIIEIRFYSTINLYSEILKIDFLFNLKIFVSSNIGSDEVKKYISTLKLNDKILNIDLIFQSNTIMEEVESYFINDEYINVSIYNKSSTSYLILSDEILYKNYNVNSYSFNILKVNDKGECFDIYGNVINFDLKQNKLNRIELLSLFNHKIHYVTKKHIDICKDCDLKYLCVDSRLPIERFESEWFHQIECNYNPYIAKWKDEEGYCTLEECGVISNEYGFSIDNDKIAKINAELWGEEEEIL